MARDSRKRKGRGGYRRTSPLEALAWELASARERAARAEVSLEFLRAQLVAALDALEVAADEVASALRIAVPVAKRRREERGRK